MTEKQYDHATRNSMPLAARHVQKFFRAIAPVAVCAALSSGVFAADAPQNLRSAMYSSTAGEILWDRVSGPVVGYALTRNSVDLGVFDVLSYYDDTLDPQTVYTFTVASVEADGTRSEALPVLLGATSTEAPTGFFALVYSPNAVELFWDRDSEPGMEYLVSINGGEPLRTDGTSAFFNTLDSGTTYSASIRNVKPGSDSPSAAAEIEFTTSGEPSIPSQDLTPPANVRFDTYSLTSAEFFWDRVANNAPQYEISLNGELVNGGELTYATSVYFDTLEPGADYTFSIVAVDEQLLKRSEPTELAFVMPGDGGGSMPEPPEPSGSPISEENAITMLRNLFALANSYGHREVKDALADFRFVEPEDQLPGLTLINDETTVESGTGATLFRFEYACADGGIFIHEPRLNAFADANLTFEDCAISDIVRNGSVSIINEGGVRTINNYDSYTEQQPGANANDSVTIELTGEAADGLSRTGNSFSEYANLSVYTLTTQAGEQRVRDLEQLINLTNSDPLQVTSTTKFEMEGFWTQGRTLKVDTINLFQEIDNDTGFYSQGLLRVSDKTSPDYYLELDADTGDGNTFQLTVYTGDSVTSNVVDWSELGLPQ